MTGRENGSKQLWENGKREAAEISEIESAIPDREVGRKRRKHNCLISSVNKKTFRRFHFPLSFMPFHLRTPKIVPHPLSRFRPRILTVPSSRILERALNIYGSRPHSPGKVVPEDANNFLLDERIPFCSIFTSTDQSKLASPSSPGTTLMR